MLMAFFHRNSDGTATVETSLYLHNEPIEICRFYRVEFFGGAYGPAERYPEEMESLRSWDVNPGCWKFSGGWLKTEPVEFAAIQLRIEKPFGRRWRWIGGEWVKITAEQMNFRMYREAAY